MIRVFIRTITIIVFVVFSQFEISGQQNYSHQGTTIILKRVSRPDSSSKKRMPSDEFVYCFYKDGEICFDFDVSCGVCEVKVYNSKMEIFEIFDSEQPIAVYVGI